MSAARIYVGGPLAAAAEVTRLSAILKDDGFEPSQTWPIRAAERSDSDLTPAEKRKQHDMNVLELASSDILLVVVPDGSWPRSTLWEAGFANAVAVQTVVLYQATAPPPLMLEMGADAFVATWDEAFAALKRIRAELESV